MESKEQKFCASCGSEISDTPGAAQAPPKKVEENKVPSPVKSAPVYESKPINVGGPGPHSKKTLAFAIVSLVLGGVGFAFGGIYFMRMLNPYYYYYSYMYLGPISVIIAGILNVTGLIFGILSRTNCSKARKTEPVNTLEKVGSVFGIFGIIVNSIPVVVLLVLLIIGLISFLMYMAMYSMYY
ncbi:MAG: hypothetical protein KAW66_05615 [Candidatus Lokiarchaeota archaeon]|nr:hypothetical protein [Candidatus Lokiarchaeota archaeon]